MGGRGTSSGRSATTSGMSGSIGSMAVGVGAGNVQFQMAQNPPHTAPTQQVAAQENDQVFKPIDNSPFHQLYNGRQYYQNQNLTVSQQMGIMDYIDPNTVPGSLYAASQNLNTAMIQGRPLTAQQTYMRDTLNSAMHNLGYNVNLTRYDHAAYVNKLLQGTGLDMNTASIAQLQNALIGRTGSENRFLSTSYNDFKNAPSNNPFTDRQVRIVYRAKANTQVVMPGDTTDRNGRKLSWGEMIVAPKVPQRIVGVREISKSGARAKGTQWRNARQIELIIEIGY